jgi:hypothetical protein
MDINDNKIMTLEKAVDVITHPMKSIASDYIHAIGIITEALQDGRLVIKDSTN